MARVCWSGCGATEARAAFVALTEAPVIVQDSRNDFLAWDRVRNVAAKQITALVSLENGDVREILSDATPSGPGFSADGAYITYSTAARTKTSYTRRDGTEYELFRLDLADGSGPELLRDTGEERMNVSWNDARDAPVGRTRTPTPIPPASVSRSSAGAPPGTSYCSPRRTPVDGGLYRSWNISDDGGTIVYTMSDGDRPNEIRVASGDFSEPRRLTESNPQLEDVALTRSELVEYLDVDGNTLYGILYYPVGYEPGRRYPLVAEIYHRAGGWSTRTR